MTYIGIIEKEGSALCDIAASVLKTEGLGIAFACSSFREYRGQSAIYKVDLMFICLPGELESLNIITRINKENPDLPMILILHAPNERFLLKAIKTGVLGFLNAGFTQSSFNACISAVLAGESFLEPCMQRRLFDLLHCEQLNCNKVKPASQRDALSEREIQIVRLIVKGYTNKEIGECLFISHHTVNEHLKRIFRKLNVNSRVKLINNVIAHFNLKE